ncbi:unnamed protein product [Malassezia sympodialis ATCC 42132]|uniref:uncharacterized protein n=1 Tax=Malassezia sympodialis (strain ATCC 42132) TaxID=1230383 RepID=UPI0002C1CF26|nr:uncharacterized protein MSY001_2825 [Malassezia sympodialis ATCC 42132]CCV00120.1 unnamed protein product [Malassezia sympodialis ATCC 42132]|eukprot:XP_018741329.1 uncharacterized protein MSY001_2825 [Malassezia sympodialis ATCC 42132]
MEAHATSAQQASAPPDSANHATVTESQEKSEETTQTTASETESNSTDSSAIESKAWGPWGSGAPWGNLFSTATKFAGHARDEIGRRTAAISQTNAGKTGHSTDQQIYDLGAMMAKRVRGLVHDAHLDQLGQNLSEAGRKGWNDIMNAVALPVEVHDSVNVTVSHEHLVFNVLSRALSQADMDISVELDEASAHTKKGNVYDLNAAKTRAEGIQVARKNLHRIMNKSLKDRDMSEKKSLTFLTCPVLLRIQPFLDDVFSGDEEDLFAATDGEETSDSKSQTRLYLPGGALSDVIEGAVATVAQVRSLD